MPTELRLHQRIEVNIGPPGSDFTVQYGDARSEYNTREHVLKVQTHDGAPTREMEWTAARPFKVSGNSDARNVAGAIANAARRGSRGLVISACGAAAINQAVKSIAIARGAYLEHDDLEIDVFGVELANDREFKHLVYIDLQFVRTRERPTSSFRRWTTHKVKGSSTPGRVAGAIASCLRDGVCCQVSVVGAEAMLKAILAIAFCSTYLETDPSSFSLMLWPDFDTIHVGEERLSGVSLYIVPARR
jgi:stage V sporulation protein SpoVS